LSEGVQVTETHCWHRDFGHLGGSRWTHVQMLGYWGKFFNAD